MGPLLVMVTAGLGTAIGSYRGCLNAPGTLDPGAPRVARAHSTELADYSTTEERWATRLIAPVIGLALVTTLVVWDLVPVKPAGGILVPFLAVLGAIAVACVSWLLGTMPCAPWPSATCRTVRSHLACSPRAGCW